uniref:[histone H3]-lysine(36) N-trimethyltransferase n=1 Tax=Schizaphis graminum TaxID=13262 RepID=A0A2S2NNW2_SCHGA
MDESYTENNSLMRQFNKQVEKPSNKRNLSSDLKLLDENHSNIDLKSNLPTRKQRLKEYLTTTHIPDKNINSTYKLHNFSGVKLINFVPKIDDYNKPVKVKSQWTRTSQLELALENSASLQTNNTQPVNNLSKYEKLNEVFTMAVSPTNGVINQINEFPNTIDTRKTNKKSGLNIDFENNCRVVVHKFDDNSVQVKRKRGRPKKTNNNIKDNTSINSNIVNQQPIITNSTDDIEPKTTNEPKVVKRGRGRPKKNGIIPTTIQIPPSVSNSVEAKKRKTRSSTSVKKRTKLIRKSDQFENEDPNDSELPKLDLVQPTDMYTSEAINSISNILNNEKSLSLDTPEINDNCLSSDESEGSVTDDTPILIFPDDGVELKCISLSKIDEPESTSLITLGSCDRPYLQDKTESMILKNVNGLSTQEKTTYCVNFLEGCDDSNVHENTKDTNFLDGCDNLNVQENTKSINFLEECDNLNVQENSTCGNFLERRDTRTLNIDEFSVESKQDVFSELENVDWNSVPKRVRSNSVSEGIKIQNRRNSLSYNFVYNSSKKSKVVNEDIMLLRSWKSLSYLEGGPNVQVERIIHDELVKKFRSKLKRSRSFPNCLFLDTVIWRFLVYQQEYNSEEGYEMIPGLDSDSDTDSESDMSLKNEIPADRRDHHYRSNSMPKEHYKQPKEKISHISRSLENLNILCSTNDPPFFQTPSNLSNLKNTESDPEETEGKIRRSKRLNTKMKNSDMLEEEYLLSSENSKADSLLLADEIRKENERNLAEARANDSELDKKLKKLNFTLITNNLFRPHRKKMSEYTPAEAQELRRLKPRRIINSDTYKCHCKYTRKDWIEKKPGCATECLNRLLNIECGKACVLKSLCTNKQFQNKQFKRTKIVKTADKGYGVFALEDIPSGTFVDEYMGEVIDQNEMIKRMKLKVYMFNNYMVQLKHDEIIDATRKGNITRFINHSCEPNCVAEKWNVLGESRMGFFSKQFIRKGEEITFDYSFEIFGDAAQQKCYCGTSKCRGFISKKSRTGDQSSSDESSSDESESDEHVDDTLVVKSDTCLEKKKKPINKISNKDKKRLRQLDKQLTDISKLKNKNRSDMESSTLNLNKLMVHITDSMSRSHILKFIRDNDLNCKRLFMNFNGLNIIHSWMTSNNNENLKLEIVQTLSDLPISNRNTITKSKVLDIVAQWANIPLNIKETIENLNYPISQIKEHEDEVDKLLPDVNNTSALVQAARVLWKKWIVLKIVFKIPKLDRPKEANIADDISQPPIHFSQPKPNSVPCNIGNPTVESSQPSKISYMKSQSTGCGQTNSNSMDTLNKIINHHNQINNRDKKKSVFEWNKKHWALPFKTNKDFSSSMINYSSNSILNPKQSSTSKFKSRIIHIDIPTIENSTPTKNIKWSDIAETNSTVYDVSTDSSEKINSKSTQNNRLFETEPTVYYPIEEIITTNQTWNLPPPTITDLCNGSTLHSMLKTVPPCLPNDFISNTSNTTSLCLFSNDTNWCVMQPENVMYDAQHPSIQEQLAFLPIDIATEKSTITQLNNNDIDKNYKVVQPPLDYDMRKKLFKQCEKNVQQLVDKRILNMSKSAKLNYLDQSPIKILQSFFNKNPVKSTNMTPENNQNQYVLPNLIKRIKVISNGYRKQPSKIIEINNKVKSNSQKSKNDIFRIKEDQKTEITDTTSIALILHNEQLSTVPEALNLNKVFGKQSFKANTKNRLALKILNGLIKHNSAMPKNFILQFPLDTKIITYDPLNELDIHYKLIPSVQNILCAKLNRGDGKNTINVYKQKIVMKYDEKKILEPFSLRSILKENIVLSSNNVEITQVKKQLKRKMPLPPLHNAKNRKIVNSSLKNKSRNQATIINKNDDNTVFKIPMIPVINKRNSPRINTTVTIQTQEHKTLSTALLNSKINDFRSVPSTSSHTISDIDLLKVNINELNEEPNISDPLIINNTSLKTNANEIRQKPLMKCSPFNKVDNILITELEQNAKVLASSISMDSTDILPSVEANSELIDPIVKNFKNSISQNKSMVRGTLVDDPIVRDYIQRTQLKTNETKRKFKLPESMMSLPDEVLDLVPDNQREIKYVIDFYHAMATVIVKVLDLYVKKSCKQGRIKNDDDFKYLAKKLNSNILFKELQVKKVEDLRISDSVKQKVEQYIKKYMLKYGKLYRRKSTDQ